MSTISEKLLPLTDRDRATIAQARAAARARFAHEVDDHGDGSAGDLPDSVDPENPPLTEVGLAALRPAEDVVPGLVAARLRLRVASSER